MKFFKNFFKKKIDESNLKNKELFPNYSLEHEENFDSVHDDMKYILDSLEDDSIIITPAGEEPTEEQINSLLKINKNMTYLEKVPILFETFRLGFEPAVELKSAKARIGRIYIEKRGEYEYKFIYAGNAKLFLETANYTTGEFIQDICMQGNPDTLIGMGAYAFVRSNMFNLALKIIGENKVITIFRDDLGYQRVEFTRDDLNKYISDH